MFHRGATLLQLLPLRDAIFPYLHHCMQGREELRQRLLDHDRRRGGQAGTPAGRQRVLLHSRVLASYISELQGYIAALHESNQLCPQSVLDRLDYCQNLEAELTGSYVPQRHSSVAPALPESDVGPQLYPEDIARLIATPAPVAAPSALEDQPDPKGLGIGRVETRIEARVIPVPPTPPSPPAKSAGTRSRSPQIGRVASSSVPTGPVVAPSSVRPSRVPPTRAPGREVRPASPGPAEVAAPRDLRRPAEPLTPPKSSSVRLRPSLLAPPDRKTASPAVSAPIDLTGDVGPPRQPDTPPPLHLIETESVRHLVNNTARQGAQRYLSFDFHDVLDLDLDVSARLLSRILESPANNNLEIIVISYSVKNVTRTWTRSVLQTLLSKLDPSSFARPHPRVCCLYTRSKYLPAGKPAAVRLLTQISQRSLLHVDDDGRICEQIVDLGSNKCHALCFNPTGPRSLEQFAEDNDLI